MAPPTSDNVDRNSFPPGTTRLIDVNGSVLSQHASGLDEKDIILVPRPSDNPEDPLNWTQKRKWLATSCIIVYTVMVAIPSSAVYSVVTPIREATQLSLADINNGTGIMVSLSLGVSDFNVKACSNKTCPSPVLVLWLGVLDLATPCAPIW